MNMGDMKAYYSGVANMGMEYQQAKFDVTADKAKLSVGDKYLQVDKNNNLRLQLQDTRYITANPLAMNVQFDDVTAIVEKEAMDLFKQALVPLEKYASQNENDKAILDILYKTNMKLGNIDKAQEYKKRLEALKN